jgi:serine/threonine protein phosphatase PrpC
MDEICHLVYDNRTNSADIAELLVNKAKENGSSDNITALFVLLKDKMDQISSPYS